MVMHYPLFYFILLLLFFKSYEVPLHPLGLRLILTITCFPTGLTFRIVRYVLNVLLI